MTATSAGAIGSPSNLAPEASSALTSQRQVLGDVGPHLAHGQGRPTTAAELLAPDHPHPQGRVLGRADQTSFGVVRLDVVDHDPLVAELGPREQPLRLGEQRRVTAPVDREGLLRGRGLRRLEVRRDIAAAERVDRLLRVADQHHRGVTGERPVEDLPLHRVGVLELVDEHDPPPLPHPGPRRSIVLRERRGELAQQVVVGQHPEPALASLHLLAHRVGERDPPADRVRAVLGRGLQRGLRITDRGAGDRHRLLVVEDRVVLVEGEGAEVEVVDHLTDQVVEVLDQPRLRVGVAGDAERAEHHRAELVGGRDRGRVEAGQRLEHPTVPGPSLVVVAVEQQPDQVGVAHLTGQRRVVAERPLGLDQLGAHPFAQLLAGRPPERDHQHLLQQRLALGDVPRHESADGPGLAGAGAGLEQGGALGQRATDVERSRRALSTAAVGGTWGGHSGAIRSLPVSSGSQIRQA